MTKPVPRWQIIALVVAVVILVALIITRTGGDSEKRSSVPSGTSHAPLKPRSPTKTPTPTMSTAPPPSSVPTDPAITAGPVPPVGQPPPETPAPWSAPIPLPDDLDGPTDPGMAYTPPAVPAALASSFGQAAYAFVIGWSQVYVNRTAWEEEWAARWATHGTAQLKKTAKQDASNIWKTTLTYGLITYHPTVTAVVVRADGPNNALFEIVVATQGASVSTKTPTMAYAHVKIWQVAVTVEAGQPLVSAIVRLDPEEESADAGTGQR